MAETIVINGVKPYDGEYALDLEEDPLTTLEWRWVKKISGYLPLTVNEGFAGGDPDLVVAFAVIALRRGGKIQKDQAFMVADRLSDVSFDGAAIQMRFDGDDDAEADDAGPPDQTPPSGSSGGSLNPSSDPPEPDPATTGTADSETPTSAPA